MHDPVAVLGRAIQRRELHRFLAAAHDIVARSGRHQDCVVSSIFDFFAIDPDFAAPTFDAEELIAIGVDLLVDSSPSRRAITTSWRFLPV